MDLTHIIFNQLGNMSLIILFGYTLVKMGILTEEGTTQIGNMLVRFVLPIVLFMGFQEEFSWERMRYLVWAFVGSLLLHGVRIALNLLFFKKERIVDKFASVFTNSGFIGVPLVQALFGFEGIFFVSIYVVISAILQWTYGLYELTKDPNSIKLKNAFLNPASMGAGLGFLMFLLPVELPEVLDLALTNISTLNAVLGMMLVGAYVAKEKVIMIFKDSRVYWTAIVISVIHPIVGLGLLWLMPVDNPYIIFALFVANSAPTAINTAIFAQVYGEDYQYGANLVILSTIVSIVVIPLLLPVVTTMVG